MSELNQIMTPVGRMVQGHPMEIRNVTDDNGQPKINKRGEQQQNVFVALAIPKGQEQHWNQTEWGQKIWAAGQAGWPAGEFNAPTFAWKIVDGDSQIPNKKGKRPCDQEGMPGHWILNTSNGFMPDCFAHQQYGQQVMRKETFKTGDYVRLIITAQGNGPSQSPGVYLNLVGCELIQAGQHIVSASSIDGQATFGSVAAQMPANAVIDPNVPAQQGHGAPPAGTTQAAPAAQSVAPPPNNAPVASSAPQTAGNAPPPPAQQQVQPAHDFLMVDGKQYTADQLRAAKWSEDQINALRV